MSAPAAASGVRGRLDAADVRAALRVTAVLERFGEDYRDRPEIRLATCPACGKRQRRASCVIDRESGRWIHHGGADSDGAPCKGDIFDLVAAFAGLDRKRDFPRVLELGATIAGITADTEPAERARNRAEHQARREARERRAAEQRAAAEAKVPGLWAALARRHPRGERYLVERGLDPAALRARGDLVRYYPDGAPAVLLHSLEDGRPINIARRQIDREPKILTLSIARELGLDEHEVDGSFSTAGTLVGRVTDIDPDGVDVAVLVEGETDSIAAALAFDTCAIVGANGWRQMPRVAAAVAPRLVEARGWLLVAVDDDDQGVAGAGDAMRAAVEAGLALDQSVHAIELGAHKDLADAWRAGWRWTWPDDGRAAGGAA
jgi:hypothetical protein